ncbi:MAG: hypothetical protein R2762_30610 [Bryobacteraceae bacterium]
MCFATAFEQIQQDLVDDRPVLIRGMALPDEERPSANLGEGVTPLDLVRINLPRPGFDPRESEHERGGARRR